MAPSGAATETPKGSGQERRSRIPSATYRLQFNEKFTFKDALALVPYLHDLGISDLYASPLLQARPGSMHGYDICDPTRLNPALGTEEEFDALVAALRERGMGLLLDTVPNHMGIGHECNAWWMDVLENGPSSPYARFFDIDWQPAKPEFQNKVLLPVLEDQYGAVLEAGKLRLMYEDGAFWIVYHQLRLPVAPGTYNLILSRCLEALGGEQRAEAAAEGEDQKVNIISPPLPAPMAQDPAILELQSIVTALSHLPSRHETDPQRVAERYREKEVVKRRLAALYADAEKVHRRLDETVEKFNGRPGDPHSFDLLDHLLEAQIYRPAFWSVAGEEINYRRFSTSTTLRRSVSRHPRSSPRHISWFSACLRKARRRDCASITPTASGTPRPTSSDCRKVTSR